MTIAMYPGRFDPVTIGHVDIVTRASQIFDRVIIAVAESRSALFSTDERRGLFANAVAHLDNVEVTTFSGLTVEEAQARGATVLVRGMRAITDFTNEFDQALMNRKMAPDVESVYLMTAAEHMFLSASRVRELAGFGRDVSDLVPPGVADAIVAKFAARG
ncbi:MAG: pantetheine-phosphate adenylyltransferase [Chloroflexi bacterium]|nr:pantetheine-phosphate adenylyltransferase [Chloroflexota bacterium]MDA1147009.1 pantetheine-phosphate adenylyltransferase [Chloroflexota bacterium]